MAGSFNTITIVGNLGRDPESRFLPDGTQVTDFSVATTERRKNQDDQTTWFKVAAFGKLAETCSQYLHKGSYVYVEGALSQNNYTDREGNAKTSLQVRAREMRMLDKVGENNAGHDQPAQRPAATPQRATRPAPAQQESSDPLGDLPF